MDYQPRVPKEKAKKHYSAFIIILRDVILLGLALIVFALFHHVLPQKMQPVDTARYASLAPATASPSAQSGSTALPSESPNAAP